MRLLRSLLSVLLAIALVVVIFFIWRKASEKKFGSEGKTVVEDGNVIATVPVDMASDSSSDGVSFTIHITQAQLGVLFEKAISEKLTVENVGVIIDDGGEISLIFRAGTEDLARLLLASGAELPKYLRFGVSLLGDTMEVNIAAKMSAADGQVKIEPTAFGMMGLSIGLGSLPDSLVEAMNQKVNEYISENIGKVTSIGTKDHTLTISGNLKT